MSTGGVCPGVGMYREEGEYVQREGRSYKVGNNAIIGCRRFVWFVKATNTLLVCLGPLPKNIRELTDDSSSLCRPRMP